MDNDILTSRFFTYDDKKMTTIVFDLPPHWWSRPYEYAWAADFCNKTDIVLDAACGIQHPFKFYLTNYCKTVYAIDEDTRINDCDVMKNEIRLHFGDEAAKYFIDNELYKGVRLKQGDIRKLPYTNGKFDTVFCISVLEHLSDDNKWKAIKEFKRVLKNDGKLILTLDYPDTNIDTMEEIANKNGFKLAGAKDTTIPQNAINWYNQLYCFRMVLVKNGDDN